MIGQYTLKMLCEKYKLNTEKIVNKSNNILELGRYCDIEQTLNYLINELYISQSNIEKCPSILYKNVGSIKTNVLFLKKQKIIFSNIETCLHVLSSNPNELIKTYNYVKDNYNENIINKITGILAVPQKIIMDVENLNIPFLNKASNLSIAVGIAWGITKLDEIQKIIQSKEFKEYPELFTSTTFAYSKLDEIQKIIQSKEFKDHPELFTSQTLAHAKLDEIQKIIRSKEFKDHPELFTSQTLAHTKLDEIQKIIQSQEFKDHPELFTSQTLAHAKLDEIQKIIRSQEFKDYPELFTSTTLAHAKLDEIQKIIRSQEFKDHPELFTSETLAHAKLEDIQQLLKMDCWKDDRFKKLLTSSIISKSKSMISKIPILIQIVEYFGIDRYLNTSFLLNSPSQNYALIQYLNENNIPLIINEKLNLLFGKQPWILRKKYNIDINYLIVKYPLKMNELKDIDGGCKNELVK